MTTSKHVQSAARLAEWTVQPPLLPETVAHLAHRAFIDTVGVMIAGGDEGAPSILADRIGERLNDGATLTAGWARHAPVTAALVNGTAAHALDYDDVSGAYDGHPSAPVLPAALAVAEAQGSSGEDLLVGYARGIEAASVLGYALGTKNYSRGFHTTSIVGTVGSCVAASYLHNLDEVSTRRALGIAASYSSGLKKNFGTMTKPYHCGLAARAGVEAAELAASGFTADEEIFSNDIGMLAVFGASEPLEFYMPAADSATEWLIDCMGISLKKYPCCYQLSRSLDGILALSKDPMVDPEKVQDIEVAVEPRGASSIIHDRPSTGLEGKFSLPYAISAALIDGEINLSTFTDQQVNRPRVQQLIRKVTYQEKPDPFEEETSAGGKEAFSNVATGYSQIRLHMKSGDQREVFVRTPRGAPNQPMTESEIKEKFLDAATSSVAPSTASAILDRLWHLSDIQDAREIFDGVS